MPLKESYKPDPIRCISQPFVVAGCLVKKNNKFLLVEENGKYNFPQGWIKLGEKLDYGAKRETEEETGLEVKITSMQGIYTLIKKKKNKTLHKIKVIYNANLTGRKKRNSENLKIEWMSEKEIKNNLRKMWDTDMLNIIKNKEGYKKL